MGTGCGGGCEQRWKEVPGPHFPAPGELETRRFCRRLAPAALRLGSVRGLKKAPREGAGSAAAPRVLVPCGLGVTLRIRESEWKGITPGEGPGFSLSIALIPAIFILGSGTDPYSQAHSFAGTHTNTRVVILQMASTLAIIQ